MKVAIAGTGPVAQYLIEELQNAGHDIVVLTRNPKTGKAYEQRQTDYTIPSLIGVLEDRDALVSTVADYVDLTAALKVHLDMLEAVEASEKCRYYIPSEWTLNVEDYPEQPMFFAEANRILHQRLKQAKDVQWTIVSNSWFSEYVLPQKQRYLRDIAEIWPMDYANKVFTIYGPGTQQITFTSVRDVAKGVAALFNSKEPWEHYTYLSGEQISWNELFAIVKKHDPEWKSKNKSLAETIQQIVNDKSPESVMIAQFEIQSYSGALTFPEDKVENHRQKYFPEIHFRTVEEIVTAGAEQPEQVI